MVIVPSTSFVLSETKTIGHDEIIKNNGHMLFVIIK